jgi:Pseudouridylate synthase
MAGRHKKIAVSVQGEIEKAISMLLKIPIIIMGSGRTDTGVHASQQFAHFDFEGELNQFDFLKKIKFASSQRYSGIFSSGSEARCACKIFCDN